MESLFIEKSNDAGIRPLIYLPENMCVFAGAKEKVRKGFVPS